MSESAIASDRPLGATVTTPRPTNHAEMTELLRGLHLFATAKEVPDPEILGEHSPTTLLQNT